MRYLSKSRLIDYRICPKRLWLAIHRSSLVDWSAEAKAQFEVGKKVGILARKLYDAKGKGVEFDPVSQGFDEVVDMSMDLLESSHPIFEAGFVGGGGRAYADVMLPLRRKGQRMWRMVEVKSASSVKDNYRDDVAIQAYIARAAGVNLHSVAVAHIDSTWVYPGGDDFQGFLTEVDLTEEAFGREEEVKEWIAQAGVIARKRKEPEKAMGEHCEKPYACGFFEYCQRGARSNRYSVACLKGIKNNQLKKLIEVESVSDLRKIPDEVLNPTHLRVKNHTLAGTVYFDADAAAGALAPHKLPAFFLDFETINHAIPLWKGTRPFQKIPFQFSLHRLSRTGKVTHQSFLDLSGQDPSKKIAEALISACGQSGPVFAYHASFEGQCIGELAKRFPRMARPLLAINDRLVDLEPIARAHYYHPDQQGSWSLKSVLPTIAPDLSYDNLEGVQDGGMAMNVYHEAIYPETTPARKAEIERQLLVYCHRDTEAMIRMWQFFTGRHDFKL